MIKINFYKNGFEVSGHANYAQHGSDIVCAGVSGIVNGALNWFDEKNVLIKIHDGYVLVLAANNDAKTLEYFKLIQVQLEALNHREYKKYLEINYFPKSFKE